MANQKLGCLSIFLFVALCVSVFMNFVLAVTAFQRLDETPVRTQESSPITRTVDNHIARLRQKIEPDPSEPQHIVTVHRLGYRFIE